MPMVKVLMIVRWRGRYGYGQLMTDHRDREQHRVDGLGHEQVRRALDVGHHPPALGHDAGQGRELAVEEHELRDGARRGRARAHRHADVGVLQRQRVVHAVAGHRHDVALRLQRADHRPLLLGRDPPEHPVLLEHLGHLVLVLGELAGVVAAVGSSSPTRAATAATVRGLSPEITRSCTPCAAK